MPGTPQILQDFTPILKNVYTEFRKKAFPVLTPLLANAKKGGPDRVTYAGNDLFFLVKLGRRGGMVSSTQGFLPISKVATEKQGRLSVARTYAVGAIDGLALKATAAQRGSYLPAAKKVVEDIMDEWQIEQNRILHGDSRGVRAVIVTATSTTSSDVYRPYGITGSGPGNLHLTVGDEIAILDSTGATLRGKGTITAITLSGDTATLTHDAISNTAATDLIVSCVLSSSDTNDTSYGAEPFGIMGIVDVEAAFATFESINDSRWVTYNTTATTVDELIVMRVLNTIRNRSGIDWRNSAKKMLLLTTTGIWQAYGETLLGLRRFSAPTMVIEGGFKATEVAGAALIDDPWAPRGRLYAIHTPSLIWVDLLDFGMLSYQDSPEWRASTTRDAYECVYGAYWNFGTTLRNAHGVISGITDTTNYSPVF